MKRGVTLLMVIMFVPWFLNAQEDEQQFTLNRAVEYALKHNKQLQSSKMEIDLFKKKVTESISQGLPQINGNITYNTNFNHKMDFGEMHIKMKDQSNAVGQIQQLLFSGQWIVGVQTSKIAEKLTSFQVESTQEDVIESLCNTYYSILVTERMIDILKENIANMDEVFTHTKNMFEAGTLEETDVDQLRITVGQLKNSLLSMERNLQVSHTLLKIQLGVDSEANVTLTDKLEVFLDETKNDQLYNAQFNMSQNTQFKLVDTQTKLNRKMLSLERWSYAPTLVAAYSYTHKIKKPELDMSAKHAAGFTLSVPIFSGLQRKAKVDQAKITLEQSIIDQSLVQDQLNLQNSQLKFELKNAIENYNLQKENIDVAGRVLESYKNKYEHGALSSMDLTQANNNYLQAENNYTSAVLTLLQAQLNLQKLYNQLP